MNAENCPECGEQIHPLDRSACPHLHTPTREQVDQLRKEWHQSHGPAERVARRAYQDARDARLAGSEVTR